MNNNKQIKGSIEKIQQEIEKVISRRMTEEEVDGLMKGYRWRRKNTCTKAAVLTYFVESENMNSAAFMFSFDVVDQDVASLIML